MSGAEEENRRYQAWRESVCEKAGSLTYLQYILFSDGLAQVLLVAALFIAARQPAGNVLITVVFRCLWEALLLECWSKALVLEIVPEEGDRTLMRVLNGKPAGTGPAEGRG